MATTSVTDDVDETGATDPTDGAGPDPSSGGGWRRSRVLVMGAALLFLAGAVGYAARVVVDRPSGDDVGFFRDMIQHHSQALEMAAITQERGATDEVRMFAREITRSQSYEIGIMEATLAGWGASAEADDTAMGWMGDPVPSADMPGLATGAELRALEEATGEHVDALFLAMMSRHHLGGAQMAEAAVEEVDDGYVHRRAGWMARSQRAEIVEYSWARQRLGLPVPAGYADPPVLADHQHDPGGG